MVHIGKVIHHHHKRKRISQKLEPFPSKRKIVKFVDRAIYIVGGVSLLMTLPQVLKIWVEQNPTGVSLISWATYLFAAGFWVFYGVIHKSKPIIFIYSAAVILDALIVIGIILYG